MPSPSIEVVESILVDVTESVRARLRTQILLDQDDPYMIAQHSAIASSSATPGPQVSPTPSVDHSSSSRQLTLHQVLA